MTVVGDRVRLTAPMRNNPGEFIEVEDLPVGTEGTVTWVGALGQIGVRWDNGSTLMLLIDRDRWDELGG